MKKCTPKTVYWLTYLATYLVCLALYALWLVCGGPTLGDFNMILLMPTMTLPQALAVANVRRLGLSKEARDVETIERGETRAHEENCPPLELRNPPTGYLVLALLFSFFTLGIVALLIGIPNAVGKIYGVYGAIFFALVAAVCWNAYFRKAGFIARIDAKGVTGKAGWSLRKLPWAQIASCQVTQIYDLYGNKTTTIFDFKGNTGYVLLHLTTDGAHEKHIAAFKAAVAEHLSA